MKDAAKYIIGEHDFKSFKSSGENKKTTVRTIYAISIERKILIYIVIIQKKNVKIGLLYKLQEMDFCIIW